jgi:hypothetical protein
MNLLPPPEGDGQPSRQALIDTIQAHAKENGYAVTIRNSNSLFNITYLGCDRSGTYRQRNGLNETNRLRDTASRLTNCPFRVRCSLKDGLWIHKVINPSHNHEASSAVAHPILRRVPLQIQEQVENQSMAGTKPREVISSIRQATDHPILSQDVYNIKKKLRRKNLAGRTPMESLISILKNGDFAFDYKTDRVGRVTCLFFAHPQSTELLNCFPEMLLLDCTYKSNRFKLLLLNVVGSTCLNTTFHVAFAFLSKEDEEAYTWALTQLKELFINPTMLKVVMTDRDLGLIAAVRTVFPGAKRMLCTWHVEKNVQTETAVHIKDQQLAKTFLAEWTSLIYAPSRIEYETKWMNLQNTYDESYGPLIQYVKETWLDHYKTYIVRAWTDQHLHFGHRVTSRVEGAHSVLKSYLQVSTGDLHSVYEKIMLLLKNQHAEFDAAIEQNRTRTPHTARDPFYSALVGRISNYALGKLWEQKHRLTGPDILLPCTQAFTKSMGMPCAHQMRTRLQENGVLLLEDIHRHWYLQLQPILVVEPLVLEPEVAQTRGRPATTVEPTCRPLNRASRGRLPASSTRREPSSFERLALPSRPQTRSQQNTRSVNKNGLQQDY